MCLELRKVKTVQNYCTTLPISLLYLGPKTKWHQVLNVAEPNSWNGLFYKIENIKQHIYLVQTKWAQQRRHYRVHVHERLAAVSVSTPARPCLISSLLRIGRSGDIVLVVTKLFYFVPRSRSTVAAVNLISSFEKQMQQSCWVSVFHIDNPPIHVSASK